MDSELLSDSEEQTFEFARRLAESLPLPAHILLFGDLGAGKTTFTKGLASGFGVEDVGDVTSPTFALVNQYQGRMPIFHIDLYRIDSGDFDGLGLEEMFDSPDAVVVVEWAERLADLAPSDAIRIDLSYVGESERKIIVHRDGSEHAPDGESK
jgi:tRNA threonylcarbamoyladenosine biosynthesis protein TsaE